MNYELKKLKREIIFLQNTIKQISRIGFKPKCRLNTFYFYLSPNISQPGLVDRIKAILCCYYIAKLNNYDFKIVFNDPFRLSDFIRPNKVQWEATEKEIAITPFYSRVFNYRGRIKYLKPNKQYVCYNYYGPMLEELKKSTYLVHDLYSELFQLSPSLEKELERIGFAPQQYIAVHLRFVNALERFEKGTVMLPTEKKGDLIERCKKGLEFIRSENKEKIPIVVFSDSTLFLKSLDQSYYHILDTDHIKHLSYTDDTNEIMKTFVDFITISKAKITYRILSPELYKSNFSVVASAISKRKVKDIMV